MGTVARARHPISEAPCDVTLEPSDRICICACAFAQAHREYAFKQRHAWGVLIFEHAFHLYNSKELENYPGDHLGTRLVISIFNFLQLPNGFERNSENLKHKIRTLELPYQGASGGPDQERATHDHKSPRENSDTSDNTLQAMTGANPATRLSVPISACQAATAVRETWPGAQVTRHKVNALQGKHR